MRRLLWLALLAALLAGCAGTQTDPPAVSSPWPGTESVTVPALMYHHLDDAGGGSAVISEEGFHRQMDLLAAEGYAPVSLRALIDYAAGTGSLPEKPVVITFDDGYASVYERAWPILREHGFPAAVFVIGSSLGRDTYKDTGIPIIPHFGAAEVAQMAAGGMEVQSHGYDMHQTADYETGPARTDMLPLPGETEEEYEAALREDFSREAEALAACGVEEIYALAWPNGVYTDRAEELLRERGVAITFTVDGTRVNTVVRGDPESLYGLGRLNMTDDTSDETLLAYLEMTA